MQKREQMRPLSKNRTALLAMVWLLLLCGPAFVSGETVNVSIGTLPVGKSITIIYDVTVARDLPLDKTSVQQQGTVSGSNFTDVLTDDPDNPGSSSDPTVTSIDNIPPIAGFGKALDFDGTNQYVEIVDGGGLTSSDYTAEVWVRFDAIRSTTLVYRADNAGSGSAYGLYLDGSGKFVHYVNDGSLHKVTGSTIAEAGKWYHLAGVFDSGTGTARLFVNGSEEGTAVSGIGTLQAGMDRYEIGRGLSSLGDNFLDGRMDEIRIWDTALTEVQLSAWMYRGVDVAHPAETNLIAYYKLDETTGTTALDSAHANDGVFMNMPETSRTGSTVSEWFAEEDSSVTGNFTGSDPDGTSTDGMNWWNSITFEAAATQGTVSGISTNSFTYTPDPNVNGTDTITYKMFDGTSYSNEFTTTVYIAPVNDAPSASDGALTTDEDTAGSGMLSGTDIDSPNLAYSIVSNGTKGTAEITDPATGAYTYTPNANVNGADTFTFKVNDGLLDSNTATITVTINAVNDAPVADDGTLTTNEDTSGNGTLSATDIDNASLTYAIVGNGGKGTAEITDPATGAYTYTPNANANGTDTFTFKANDGLLDSNTATITVTINAVNDAPVLDPIGDKTVDEGVALTFTATVSEADSGDVLMFSLENAPAGASIDPATGVFTWTPTEAQGPGSYTLTVKVTDNGTPNLSDSVTFTITVDEVCTSSSITVIDAGDSGAGTLRQAIDDICSEGTIEFGAGVSGILLTSGELFINKNMSIAGPVTNALTISGNNNSRVFMISAGVTATIQDINAANGSSDYGGGIYNSGTLTVENSTISDNSSDSAGGGIYNYGTLTMTNSTIYGNGTDGDGGGIWNSGTLTVENSTISGNISVVSGGGIYNSGTLTATNSIIANNNGGNCSSGITDGGNNLEDSSTCGFSDLISMSNTDPMLDPEGLQDNGGPTQTIALLPGSPAIDAGNDSTCSGTDQRGISRPKGTHCDIGAYEFVPDTVTALLSSSPLNTSIYGESVTFTATVTDSEAASDATGAVTFKDGGSEMGCTGVALSSGSATCTLNSLTGGDHTITAEFVSNNGFSESASDPLIQTVNKADQTIDFGELPDKTSGAVPFEVTASATPSELTVGFSSLTASICTVSGNTVTLTHLAGLCTIQASQPGDLNYNAASQVNRSFNVNPAVLDHISVSPAVSVITAGGSEDYTVEGFDLYNNSLGDLTGSSVFAVTPDGSCTGSACGATVSGTHTVTAEISGKTASATLTVNAGVAVSLSIGAPGSSRGGQAFDLLVTAKDVFNNIAVGYTGTVHFTSTDSDAVLPGDYTFNSGDNGTVTFTGGATLKTAGSQIVSATDILNASITGSANISVSLFIMSGTLTSGNGTISCSPSAVFYGGEAVCTLCPAKGYDLYRLYDNGANKTDSFTADGNCYSYTVAYFTADHEVKAIYRSYPVLLLYETQFDSYLSIQSAFNETEIWDRIQLQGRTFIENPGFNRPGVSAWLDGGYDSDFNSRTGHSVIRGSLTIIDGTLWIEDITIW